MLFAYILQIQALSFDLNEEEEEDEDNVSEEDTKKPETSWKDKEPVRLFYIKHYLYNIKKYT